MMFGTDRFKVRALGVPKFRIQFKTRNIDLIRKKTAIGLTPSFGLPSRRHLDQS